MVGPTVAMPLVMHAQASDYEASRKKCGSCCKGLEIRYLNQGVQIHSENYHPRKLSPLKKKIYRVNNQWSRNEFHVGGAISYS